jgi:hypothetical protein
VTRASEPHVAVDPQDANVLYVAYNGGGGSTVSVTQNGGATWQHTSIGQTVDSLDGGDPVLAVHPSTREVWHAFLTDSAGMCSATHPYAGQNAIHVVHSGNFGASWSAPISVSGDAYYSDDVFLDKPWLTIAPNGTIFVSFTVFPTAASVMTADIVVAWSQDNGANWQRTVVNDRTPDRARPRQLSGLTTDAASNLYVVWEEETGNPEDFGGYVFLTKLPAGATAAQPNVRVTAAAEVLFDDPQIAVTPDGARVYIVYGASTGTLAPDQEDVKATVSTDGGHTFAAPILINDDPSCATHWHPAATLDGSGNLWITYYDNRYGDGRVSFAKLTGGSVPLAVAQRGAVTDAPGPFTTSRLNLFLGDYIGLAAGGGKVFAVWADLRSAATQGVGIYLATAPAP